MKEAERTAMQGLDTGGYAGKWRTAKELALKNERSDDNRRLPYWERVRILFLELGGDYGQNSLLREGAAMSDRLRELAEQVWKAAEIMPSPACPDCGHHLFENHKEDGCHYRQQGAVRDCMCTRKGWSQMPCPDHLTAMVRFGAACIEATRKWKAEPLKCINCGQSQSFGPMASGMAIYCPKSPNGCIYEITIGGEPHPTDDEVAEVLADLLKKENAQK
jgi:hypothetical protein